MRRQLEKQPLVLVSPLTGDGITHLPDIPDRMPHEILSLGVDPGVTGAWALIGLNTATAEYRLIAYDDIPVIEYKRSHRTRRRIDTHALIKDLREPARMADVICTEIVFAPPGISSTVAFSLGMSASSVWAAIDALPRRTRAKHVEVAPRSWKTHFKLGQDKPASVELAAHLFGEPVRDHCWKRVKDHNRAEAALIAVWAAISCAKIVSRSPAYKAAL